MSQHPTPVLAHQYLAALKIVVRALSNLGYDDEHCALFEKEIEGVARDSGKELEAYANDIIYSALDWMRQQPSGERSAP